MMLLRVIHAAEMPDPASIIARLQGGGTVSVGGAVTSAAPSPMVASATAPTQPASAQPQPASFPELVDSLERDGKALLALKLRDGVGLVRFAPGELVLRPLQPVGTDFPRDLAAG